MDLRSGEGEVLCKQKGILAQIVEKMLERKGGYEIGRPEWESKG